MTAPVQPHGPETAELRDYVLNAIAHLDHILPGQAPIHDFVHHNTLHGFQHLPFEQALAEFQALTGIDCYLPATEFRKFYAQGRIDDSDLDAALRQAGMLSEPAPLFVLGQKSISRRDLYRAGLLHDLTPLPANRLSWQLQQKLSHDPEQQQVWQAVLALLNLQPPDLHPEQLLDLSDEQAQAWSGDSGALLSAEMQRRIGGEIDSLFAQVGRELTMRGLLQALTGTDALEQVRPQLIRWCAIALDEGMAAWQLPAGEQGLYSAWLASAGTDLSATLQELSGWRDLIAELPADPVAAIVQQLQAMAIPCERWETYLQRLALELPGWSGLINWRQTHPSYRRGAVGAPRLADYLALRLVLDRLYLEPLCREQWRHSARLDKLRGYFDKNPAEFSVRVAVFAGELPEYLQEAGQALLASASPKQAWQELAERIWTWRRSPLGSAQSGQLGVCDHGWRAFGLCRALELSAAEIGRIAPTELLDWLKTIEQFDPARQSQVWLTAYERHYRQQLLQALHANRGRGRWAKRNARPQAQIIFCMDDREEGIRRHLEELNPAIETLGAAGFFGVPMNYRGLDDSQATPLCPVVVVPAHEVNEASQAGQEVALAKHRRANLRVKRIAEAVFHGLRRHVLVAYPLLHALAPLTLLNLLLKGVAPARQAALVDALLDRFDPQVASRLAFNAKDPSLPATPEHPRHGFTDREQAERVAGFLRNTGLTYGFAELVVLMGHGSISQNNPHLAAYDCGACSGRHGGPNARLFAAMANRAEVRALLAERGINIPADTWFVGAEHNTGNEQLTWYDDDAVPGARRPALQRFQSEMQHARQMSAHERCRRLASAPRRPKPAQALRHFFERTADYSQARPELGHATNASALVGRRALSQGAFFDRRLFLISYDPTQDPDGSILEGILLAVGPVGAGINLEYYFSTVNNERLGCGSKVPHNPTGFFAVMEGATSDLRTGLPRQMIEIHEAMRLQLVVEAKTQVLERIYARQAALQELVGGGWLHLSAIDPDDGAIQVFERGRGFVAWQPQPGELPVRASSPDCYREETGPVATLLIQQPTVC